MPIILFVAAFACPTQATPAEEPNDSPMRLELVLPDPELHQCEPLVVEVRLTNTSGKKLIAGPEFAEDRGILRFRINDSYERQYEHRWFVDSLTTGPRMQEFAPGETIVHRHWLFFGVGSPDYFLFPGDYRIEALFWPQMPDAPGLELKSKSIPFKVRRVKPDDVVVWDYFRDMPQAIVWLDYLHSKAGAARSLGYVTFGYPDSPYAPWAYYFLGYDWQRKSRKEEPGAAEQAILMYETLLEKYPEFPLAVEVRYELAKEMIRLERTEEARKLIDQLIESHPQRQFLHDVRFRRQWQRDNGREVTPDGH